MIKRPFYFLILFYGAIAGILLFSSCTTYHDIRYMKDVPKSSSNLPVQQVAIGPDSFQSVRIQTNDLLQVSIHTLDPQINAILNQTSEGINSTSSNSGIL